MAIETRIVKIKLGELTELFAPYGRIHVVRYSCSWSYHTPFEDLNNKDVQIKGIQNLIQEIIKDHSAYGVGLDTEFYAQVETSKMFYSDPDSEASVSVLLTLDDPTPDEREPNQERSRDKWEKDYDTCVWLL